jgi:hypothetical protein
MRARLGIATDAHADGDVDVEKSVDKNRNDDYVDSAMKKKKSVSSTSYYSISSMTTKNPWVLLVLGIVLGAFLPTLVRHESVRSAHKHVKGAYTAHREASKEYLKRYRETYLGEVKTNYVSEKENELLLESMVKEEEKKLEEALTEEEVGTDVPVDEEGQGETTFKTLENGKHVCLPLIDEDFSDLVSEEEMNESGTVITRSECEWFAKYIRTSIEASKMTSRCIPDNHVVATEVNEHAWEIFTYAIQNIKSEKCFIDRLIVLCLDDASALRCKEDGFTHCIRYLYTLGASDFQQNDFWVIGWLKTKMVLALHSAKLTAFIHDSDVLFLQVPDLKKIVELDPSSEMFHQWERFNYTTLFENPSYKEESDPVNVPHAGLNGGQILYLPTEKVRKGLLLSLRFGKEWGTNKNRLDQELLMQGMDEVGVKRTGLSYKYNSFCSTRGSNRQHAHLEDWITFHVSCARGNEIKMQVMKAIQEEWSKLKSD